MPRAFQLSLTAGASGGRLNKERPGTAVRAAPPGLARRAVPVPTPQKAGQFVNICGCPRVASRPITQPATMHVAGRAPRFSLAGSRGVRRHFVLSDEDTRTSKACGKWWRASFDGLRLAWGSNGYEGPGPSAGRNEPYFQSQRLEHLRGAGGRPLVQATAQGLRRRRPPVRFNKGPRPGRRRSPDLVGNGPVEVSRTSTSKLRHPRSDGHPDVPTFQFVVEEHSTWRSTAT